MAHVPKGILGTGSGKVGNVVMFTRYGKSFIRTKPSVKPKKTTARKAQQQKMVLVHEFLRPVKALLPRTFKNEVSSRSSYQAAQSYHLKHAIAGEYPNQHLDIDKALVSKGEIPLPSDIRYSISDEGINITWNNSNDLPTSNGSDSLIIMWRYKLTPFVDLQVVNARRHNGSFLWTKTNSSNLNDFTLWVSFRNWEETEYSNSHCLHIAKDE